MTKPTPALGSYYELLDQLSEQGRIQASERTIRRKQADRVFRQAANTLALLQISWRQATNEYRMALECHANQRHDIPFAPSLEVSRHSSRSSWVVRERCERCDTMRLRTIVRLEDTFLPGGHPRYEHSQAYEVGGRRSEVSNRDYRALLAAIQMMEQARLKARQM